MRIRKAICILLALTMLLSLAACGGGAASSGDASKPDDSASAVLSVTGDPLLFISDSKNNFVLREDAVKVYSKSELDESKGMIIYVDPEETRHEIEGFGASFTDTACYALSQMPKDEVDKAYLRLFDQNEGIGLNIIRNCIGSSDFALEYYTYNDIPEGQDDYALEKFDFSHDLKQIVPYTKRAYEMIGEDRYKMILSPWTAPLWMKSEYVWQAKYRAILRRDCYNTYAKYLVKTIQAWEEQGIPVSIITPQNEPWFGGNWPGMWWEWESLANFANDNLRPALDDAGLDTRILNVDYNFKYQDEAENIMASTLGSTQGIAWHWYSGNPEVIADAAKIFPDVLMYVTEASSSRPHTLNGILNKANKIARSLYSGASAFVDWNMALDQTGGPTYNDINEHCSGLVECNTETGKIKYGHDYFALAHYSKYIHVGAKVLKSTDTGAAEAYEYVNVVAKNPNGSITAVITNQTIKDKELCKLVVGNTVLEFATPSRSVVTVTWDANV
ncbi:MAG: hypothetical protein J6B93_04300 [Clostridia bacterium]|nr:hypothetical protein [Clostridia bacterium]